LNSFFKVFKRYHEYDDLSALKSCEKASIKDLGKVRCPLNHFEEPRGIGLGKRAIALKSCEGPLGRTSSPSQS
jgi:hypothetical protein